ncbi:hypothetical protein BRE01_62400 [Brevibacillus reuszeri]|uniref:Uncharacterized protein n=1 Tax=Brevibacillus reuszeri TaxID=54915 RepID=A0A0K9YW88_9BACL|nr:hypothetical protein [Brevibacillus reuszeri]KNB72936.1 hypothetical protein ADS79_14005 [Brevibacillus reuszeri]GED72538.1 hypothetical protein BRE01_62400 [Brevibacillus reuszeri]
MEKGKLYLIGGICGLFLSVILSVVSSFAIIFVIGGWDPNIPIWFFLTSFIPFIIIYSILAVRITALNTKKRSIMAAFTALLILLYAGSIGASLVASYKFGYQNVNIMGYFQYAPIYAFSLLPVTWPVAYFSFIILESVVEWKTQQKV